MKKFHLFILFTLISTSSCGHVQKTKESPDKSKLKTVVSAEVIPEIDETREIAEANADDQEIKAKVGSNEIDEELSEGPKIETKKESKPFLLKKNTRRMQFWVNYFTEKDRA